MLTASVYQLFFNTSRNALFLLNADRNVIRVNQAACEMLGYTEEELVTSGYRVIVDTNDPDFIALLGKRVGNEVIDGYITAVKKNGEKFPIKISSVLIQDEDGNPVTAIVATDISDIRQQEEKLKNLLEESKQLHQQTEDSRKLLENVLDSVTDGFFIVDREWKVLFWNKAAEKILGKPEQELIGKVVWEEFPELDFLREHENYRLLYDKNQSIRFREYFPKYQVWADVSVYPSDKSISVYFKDVTEIKSLRTFEKLERDVLEMNAKPDSIIEPVLDFYLEEIQGIYPEMLCSVQRIKGNKLYPWSAPALPKEFSDCIYGMSVADYMGSCGTAAFRKEKVVVSDIENDVLWCAGKEAALKAGLKACWSFPIIDLNNKVIATFAIYYRTIKSPTKEEESTLERVKNFLTVILENRLSLETVKTSNQNYEMVALATNDAIWDWQVETNEVVRTGKGLKALFGYDTETAAAEPDFWRNRIHPEDIGRVYENQVKVMNDPSEMYWVDEYRFLKSDGKYAYVFDKGYIIRDENGKAVRLIGATRDVTDRKENEALLLDLNNRLKHRADELAASNVELERFAYIASHDMQEPLRMITSFLQLFKKKYEDQIDETAEQYIHFAVDGAERMKKLIMDLLEYSRVGSNKDDLEEIDTNILLKEVVNVFVTRIDELQATMVVNPLPVIKANKVQLFQLFQNLIGNALKYHSGEAALVEVSGWEEENDFVFSVRDNGIGIKPVFFEKIFVLFQRLHHKTEYSGTGIGLAICKKIVDRHGGKIWVTSEPGKGSCFYFSISKSAEQYR